jgi:hypothetical protein
MGKMRTYDPGQVILTGPGIIVQNFESITVAYDEDHWSFTTGSAGENTRTKSYNRMGSITVELAQASPENLIMSALARSDALGGWGLIDKSGASVFSMPEGTILKPADAEFDKTDAGTRSYEIKGELPVFVNGGNR